MRKLYSLLALLLAGAAAPAFAQAPAEVAQQKLEQNHKIVFFGDGGADSSAYSQLINRFYLDQFRHSQDPRAPYFMLMSRNANMAMGIGGTIQVNGCYDFDGTIPGVGFATYDIPIPVGPDRTSFQTYMGQSALFFTVFGTDHHFGNYQLYVEAKFTGTGRTFQLKKAYATVGDWTLGLTTSTFVDPVAQPSTVEIQGPNSELGGKSILLRYMHSFDKHVTMALSAETPDNQVPTVAGVCQPGSDYMPNFAGFLQYGWGGGQHVRLSGIVKGMRYRNLIDQTNGYSTGWGVNLATIFRPVAPLTVYACGYTGAGIGNFVNDLSCGDNDLLASAAERGSMYAAKSYGWYGALQYNFSPDVFSTVIFSQERMLPKQNSIYGGDQYKYGLYGTANVFWNITPRCQMGAELNIGKRCNMDGANRMAYRASVLAMFSF